MVVLADVGDRTGASQCAEENCWIASADSDTRYEMASIASSHHASGGEEEARATSIPLNFDVFEHPLC